MIDRAARLACAALVVAVLVGSAGATGSPVSAQTSETIADTQIDPDVVAINVDLREDGSAAWTIEYRVRLDNDNTTEAFLSLQDDIEANESEYTANFRQRIESTVSAAENTTGRDMAVQNVSVEASRQQLPQDYGVISYTFVWTDFATVDDGTIRAGDSLAGFFIDSETSLRFAWPEGYGLETVQPEPDDTRSDSRVVVWNGPVDFNQDEPTLVVSERAAGGGTTTAPGDDGTEGGGLPIGAIGAIGVLVLAAGVVGAFLYRRRDEAGTPTIGARDADGAGATQGDAGSTDGTGGAADASGAGDAGGPAGGGADAAGGGSVAAAGAGAGAAAEGDDSTSTGDAGDSAGDVGGASDDEAPWEDELLSNQEQVLALVEHEGGRMKQQEVAQRLEWTDAKTSQVVRKMRDAGDLDAFRLGRENVLVLPDEEFGPGDATEE